MSTVDVDATVIADFCRRHHIRKLSLFGSRVRGDFRPDSDLDILVEFDPDHIPGLEFFAMQDELSAILGREVDLRTPFDISERSRSRVLAEAEVVYVSG